MADQNVNQRSAQNFDEEVRHTIDLLRVLQWASSARTVAQHVKDLRRLDSNFKKLCQEYDLRSSPDWDFDEEEAMQRLYFDVEARIGQLRDVAFPEFAGAHRG